MFDTDLARARLAGAIAAGVAIGTGELIAGLGRTGQSLVGAVGSEVVDRAGGDVVRSGIEAFGTNDKAVLLTTIVLVSLALGAIVGGLARQRRWVGVVAFVGFGALGAIAGIREPIGSDPLAVAAAFGAVGAGLATLFTLLRVVEGRPALPVTTDRRLERAADRRLERPTDRTAEKAASRRAFFGLAGAGAGFAVLAAVAGRALKGTSQVETARAAVRLPGTAEAGTVATTAVPGAPAGFDVPGLTPYFVPNDSFYRIDTALLVPQVDPSSWRLTVSGKVDHPFELTFDELVDLARTEEPVTISCVSNEVGGRLVGNARWQGVPLRALLDRAGVQPEGTQVVGRSVDRFTAGFPTAAVYDGRTALVAVGMNGEPLPVDHGFPARLVVAGLYGYVSATKWLREIELTGWEDVDGYWIPRGWSKEAPIKTQARIDVPRSGETLDPGPAAIAGVAWAPGRGISRVEVRVDDGPWQDATLGDVLSDNTWRQWYLAWDATPGGHVVQVRATDGHGDTQTERVSPPEPDGATGWPRRGFKVTG